MDSHLRGNDDFVGMRGNDAEGAKVTQRAQKGIPKLFENALNQCLCGLQGINGWEGAWGLVVGVFAALLCLGWNECGGERRRRRGNTGANAKGAKVTQKSQKKYQIS